MRIVKLFILGTLSVPSIVFCQTKNRISVQTGLMHCFFDGSPLMNIKYPTKTEKPFNSILINSVGLDFSRKIKEKYNLSIEAMYFFEGYRKNYIEHNIKIIGDRGFMTFIIKLNKIQDLNQKWSLVYGAGLGLRFGHESVLINFGQIAPGYWESQSINVNRSDIGTNVFGGIEYKILDKISIYSKLDFLGFIYLNDKNAKKKLEDTYNIYGFPTRFDLSLKLGIGFNF